jgi:hypothetical protein
MSIAVVTDYRRINVGVPVELRGTEEPDIDPAGLQPEIETSGTLTTASVVSARMPSPIDAGSRSGSDPSAPD